MIHAVSPLELLLGLRTPPRVGTDPGEDGGSALASLAQMTFREVVMEELLRRPVRASEEPVATTEEAALVPSAEAAPMLSRPDTPPAVGSREAEVIVREARRSGIDPALLIALRRTENGRAGREFGVLSIPAFGLEEQARVAANTVRKTMARFERQGGTVVDPATGRYTEDFLRFFSARYAPAGVANDPLGLNRFHAANLIAHYERSRSRGEGAGG